MASVGSEGVGAVGAVRDGFECWLVARGFTRSAMSNRVWQLAELSGWLEGEGLTAGQLPGRVEGFVAAHRAAGHVMWGSVASARLPLEYLREIDVAPVPALVSADGALERLVGDYREYLRRERGLVEHTINRYVRVARLFLEDARRQAGLALEHLIAADVSGFLARECPKRQLPAARNLAARLRPLLRYLHVGGVIATPLLWAVPAVADLRDRSLPRGLAAVIAAAAGAAAIGGPGSAGAITRLAVDARALGLRAGEVAALTLDDLDWRCWRVDRARQGQPRGRVAAARRRRRGAGRYLRHRPRTRSRACSCGCALRPGRSAARVSRSVVRPPASVPGCRWSGAHRCGTRPRPGCSTRARRLPEIAQVLRHSELRDDRGLRQGRSQSAASARAAVAGRQGHERACEST